MKKKLSDISVCIATYNGAVYIEKQLYSILKQIGDNAEVIISDDGSTDDTVGIIKAFNDERIHIYQSPGFNNPVKNFEYALSKASGKYIFIADQDDIWLDGRVNICLAYFSKGYDLIVNDCIIIDQEDNFVAGSLFREHKSGAGRLKNIIKNTYVGCCMAFTKEVLETALPFPNNIPMHDSWIGMVAECLFTPVFINDKLISYRRHGANFSSTSRKSDRSLRTKIKDRYFILYNIFCLLLKKK